ncbi:apolipoprotein N-acyltransferase 2 [Leptospira kobayashii]|uniref:Apolipoprotein N-acyltransferase n=1 Tax=Leptospira kobayashii TaxID=1917830 RepID=A0ABN6KDN4_9LEPT|nr:nitrilase-related carbon-nitrogen hydrolase [Leptospira kobayashii]BDA77774.1 apolipoprotein N-acyltransferase 2 [Leptospira kobayashii]
MKSFFRYFSSREGLIAILCYVVTAGFSTFAFAPFSQSYLVWIAPLGLFYIEKKYRGEWKKLIWHGFGFALVFYSFSFHWIYHMVTVFGGFPWFLAGPIFLISAIILNFKFPVFLISFSFLVKKVGRFFPWLAGVAVLFSEFFTPQVFPWYWGNVVGENHILSQNAEYASAYGLSVLLFVFSYFLFQSLKLQRWKKIWNYLFTTGKDKTRKRKIVFGLGSVFVVFLGFWMNGAYLFYKWENVKPLGTKEVLIIQPNAPLEFRDGRSIAEEINLLMERIDSLAEQGAGKDKIDLIVLPESGVPFFSTHETEETKMTRLYWDRFESMMNILALRHKANVFYNELDVDFKDGIHTRDNLRSYNSSALIGPNADRKGSYQKVYLLIFGEYMPFEWMYELSGQTGRFEAGKSLSLIPYMETTPPSVTPLSPLHWFDTANFNPKAVKEYYGKETISEKQAGSFLPLICYEVIIPEFVRKFQGDPDFIVNVTNDKWYGNSVETYQHHTLGRMRAIEFRKWIVRSTNSGTSVFTDHLGRNIKDEFTSLDSAAFLRGTVSVIPGYETFYRRYGNLLSWLFLTISGSFFVFYVWKFR